MTRRENYISLVKRQGYEFIPLDFSMCPSLYKQYEERTQSDLSPQDYFGFHTRYVDSPIFSNNKKDSYLPYYKDMNLKEGTTIDAYGVAHEPGSEAAMHMTRMISPLRGAKTVDELKSYPFPVVEAEKSLPIIKAQVQENLENDLISCGGMACTVWEYSWYIRSMEQLMMDMVMDEQKATIVLDKITEISCARAEVYAKAGVDMLCLGDDIGMQQSIMMSLELYRKWLKPRLKKIIDTAKNINPDILIFYHSCGFVEPFIDDLIEVGVDILDPIQPESMDFKEIHDKYGDRVSFHGTIGTQTVMPFGTAVQVKEEVFKNLDIAGEKGGLLPAPTHLLEPEVPWENVLAYVEACREYTR